MKKIISHRLTTLRFSGTIDDVIEELKREEEYYSKEYANLRIDNVYNYEHDGCYYKHFLCGDKLETDEEEALRMKQEEESRKWSEEHDRRQYEELKAKFEKN